MNKNDATLKYIEDHPGATSRQITKAFNANSVTVCARLKKLFDRKLITRRKDTTPSSGPGQSEYLYFPVKQNTVASAPTIAPATVPAPTSVAPVRTTVSTNLSLDSLTDDFIETLSSQLAERIAKNLQPKLLAKLRESVSGAAVDQLIELVVPAAKPENKTTTPPKKRVFLGGGLDKQVRFLKDEFGGCLDLRCLSTDDTIDRWKSNAAQADVVLLWTNFISHKHQDAVKSVGVKPVYITGGMTEVRDKLTEIYAT